jgi:hypothetical protein
MVVTCFIDDPAINQKIGPPSESFTTRIRVFAGPYSRRRSVIHRAVGGRRRRSAGVSWASEGAAAGLIRGSHSRANCAEEEGEWSPVSAQDQGSGKKA